eukprot:1193276-Prorocentrum_minimum.AAC.2
MSRHTSNISPFMKYPQAEKTPLPCMRIKCLKINTQPPFRPGLASFAAVKHPRCFISQSCELTPTLQILYETVSSGLLDIPNPPYYFWQYIYAFWSESGGGKGEGMGEI